MAAQQLYPAQTVADISTISPETYAHYKRELTRFEAWRAGRQSYHVSEIPEDLRHVSNDMRGAVEQYEFEHNPPEKYFGYWSKRVVHADGAYQVWLTTWNGELLGQIRPINEWRDNFGGVRVSFNCLGINGLWYSGTYFKSSGDYCRLRLLKRDAVTRQPQKLPTVTV